MNIYKMQSILKESLLQSFYCIPNLKLNRIQPQDLPSYFEVIDKALIVLEVTGSEEGNDYYADISERIV